MNFKNVFNALLFLLFTSLLTSCAKDAEKKCSGFDPNNAHLSTVARGVETIGYLDNTGTYQPISDSALWAYYIYVGQLDTSARLNNYEIIEAVDPATGDTTYGVRSRGTEGTYFISITSEVDHHTGTSYLIKGASCTCKSTSCDAFGCSARIFGGICECSPCGSEDTKAVCEKSSTATEMVVLRAFFSNINF